jgi:hypothetical protein
MDVAITNDLSLIQGPVYFGGPFVPGYVRYLYID